ncbi:MAG: hypothetical protein ACQEXQ_15355 [Bacillota bacterium]
MLIRKSVPYFNNNYLSHNGKPIFDRDRIRQRPRDGIKKRDRSPVPHLKIINDAEKRKSIRDTITIKSGDKYRSPVVNRKYRSPGANRKRSSPVPREMDWNGQRMDSELNELDWLEEQW